MVDVERRAVIRIAVVPDPGSHGGVGLPDAAVGAPVGDGGEGHRRNGLAPDMLRVRERGRYGFLDLGINIRLPVFPVKIGTVSSRGSVSRTPRGAVSLMRVLHRSPSRS